MNKLISVLMFAGLATSSMAILEAPSFAQGRKACSHPTQSMAKHRKGRKSAVKATSFEARKSKGRKHGGKAKPAPTPAPTPFGLT